MFTGAVGVETAITGAIRAGAHALVGVAAAEPSPEDCDGVGLLAEDVWLFAVLGDDVDRTGARFDAVVEDLQPRDGVTTIGCAELRGGEGACELVERALANYARASAARVIDPDTGRWAQPPAPDPRPRG